MANLSCEYCGAVMPEEDVDEHMMVNHPAWALALSAQIQTLEKTLDRIAAALERLAGGTQ